MNIWVCKFWLPLCQNCGLRGGRGFVSLISYASVLDDDAVCFNKVSSRAFVVALGMSRCLSLLALGATAGNWRDKEVKIYS